MPSTIARDVTVRFRPGTPAAAPHAARVLLIDPSPGPTESLSRDLLAHDVALEVIEDPLRGLVRAAATRPHAVVVSAAVSDPLLALVVTALRTELDLPVLLAHRAGDVDRLGPAVLAGGRPVVELPYRTDRLARAVLDLAALNRRAEPVRIGPLELDGASYDARLRGHGIDLSALEFGILYELASNCDHVVPRERLTQRYWPGSRDPDGTLGAVIARLRRKLDGYGAANLIHTVRGVGFRFDSAPLVAGS